MRSALGKGRALVWVFLIVLLFCPAVFAAEKCDDNDDRCHFMTDNEWFGIRAEGGSHGIGAMLSAPTLRWESIYWETFRAGVNFLGSGFTGDSAYYMLGGTSVGVPLFIDDDARHEIRLGVGAFGGLIHVSGDGGNGSDRDSFSYFSFFAFAPEFAYLFHHSKHVAFTVGLSAYIAIPDVQASALSAFMGLRF